MNLSSVVLNINSAKPEEINNSSCELRFLELEAGLRKHEELLKAFENLAKQVIILGIFFCIFSQLNNLIFLKESSESVPVRIGELFKTDETISKQLNEVKSQVVRIFCNLWTYYICSSSIII